MSELVAFTRIARRRVAGEYRIFAYNAAGERMPEADCFETTRQAALETAAAMVAPYRAECAAELGESISTWEGF